MNDTPIWYLLLGFPQVVITLPVIMGCLIAIVAVVAGYWHKAQRDRLIIDLKRSMVEQGRSADEIERVLAAEQREAD